MDPVVAVSLAGSVLGIIDVVTRSVQTLQNLQAKYKRADLTASVLIGQLSTLKAALFQISELVNLDLVQAPRHRQLVADLTISLDCCGVLIRVLDDRLQDLKRNEHGGLHVVGKAQLFWEEKDMVDIRNHLNHQTNALNLLLTASQCRSQFEQVDLLRSDESRRVFNLVKDDTSSLLWLRDAESCYTQKSAFEESSDLIDSTFDFDRELFGSKAYLVATWSNMRRALVSKTARVTQIGSPSARTSTATINRLDTTNDDNDAETIRRGTATPRPPRAKRRSFDDKDSQTSGEPGDNVIQRTEMGVPAMSRSPRDERKASDDKHSQTSGKPEDNVIQRTKDEFSKPSRSKKQISALRSSESLESVNWSRGMLGMGLRKLGTGPVASAPTIASSTDPPFRDELDGFRHRLEALSIRQPFQQPLPVYDQAGLHGTRVGFTGENS